MEKAMAPHSSTLAWKIPRMEQPGRLRSMVLLRVRHDWATSFHFSLPCIGERNGNPLQRSCPENPRGGGAWWAAVYGVAQSWTRLKWLSSSSSSFQWSEYLVSLFVKHLEPLEILIVDVEVFTDVWSFSKSFILLLSLVSPSSYY